MVKDQRSKAIFYTVFVNVRIWGRNEDPSLYIQCDLTKSFWDSFYGKDDKVMSLFYTLLIRFVISLVINCKNH